MFIEKETHAAQSKFFALADIEARSAAAYKRHKQKFTSEEHVSRVELVDSILRSLFLGYSAAYQTCRDTKQGPTTEVKYAGVVLNTPTTHRRLKNRVVEQLEALGLDLIYKPRTNSYSVHVK